MNIPSTTNQPPPPLQLPQIDAVDDPQRGIDWLLGTIGPRRIVLLDPYGRHPPQGTHLDNTTRDSAIRLVRAHNSDRVMMNTYFQLNPTAPDFRGKKAGEKDHVAIEIVGQADVDVKAGRTLEDCWAGICTLPIPPSFIIMTGGGFQIGYQLVEPLAPTAENRSWAVAVNRRLRDLTGGDAVQDISRIFRLPYTVNWPSEAKQREGRTPAPSGLVVGGGGR